MIPVGVGLGRGSIPDGRTLISVDVAVDADLGWASIPDGQ
jgi:hypothetical protein